MAKYLFCLPRYHTNAVPWTSILMAAGHSVAMDVLLKGPTENHAFLQPTLWKPGRLAKRLSRLRRGGSVDLYAFPDLLEYWRHMRTVDPDVVIVRGVTRRFCRVAAVVALLQGRKLAIYDQEDVTPRRWSGTWIRRALFNLLHVPHITSRVAETAGRRPAIGDAIPIPFGCPLDDGLREALAQRPLVWPSRLLMVAKYRERKGHSVFIEALARIAAEREFSVTFCGEEASSIDVAFRKKLEEQAERLGIAKRLNFLSNVAHQDMASIYAAHDIFVLPSRMEPAAVSPIEAGWAGCAVLISRDSGTRGYFPPGTNFDFDPNSVEELANVLSKILSGPDQPTAARNACHAHLVKVANNERIMQGFESLLPVSQQHPSLIEKK